MFLKKFLSVFEHSSKLWAKTGGAPLSAAVGLTSLTYVSCQNLLKKLSGLRQKFLVREIFPRLLAFCMLSPIFCYHFIIPPRWITPRSLANFYGCVPIFKAAVSFKILRTAHSRLSEDNFNHIISLGSPFLEFCPKFHTRAFLHILRTSWMWRTTQTLLFMREYCVTPSGWCEVSLVMTSRNMSLHAQESSLQLIVIWSGLMYTYVYV